MKAWLFSLVIISMLGGCSSDPESLQRANDTYQKAGKKPFFTPLATGSVTVLNQSSDYELPKIASSTEANVDIRPPLAPLAVIRNSLTQFDGERALIVYPEQQAEIYNLEQVSRLLKEEGINVKIEGAVLTTDWTSTGRSDDKANTEIRYQVEQVSSREAGALAVSVLQMRRDGIIFTPAIIDKQRYTSDRLNRFITDLTNTYNKQRQELTQFSTGGPIASAIITDNNGHIALAMNAGFMQVWEKLGTALPQIGFSIKAETVGRAYRELKYSALDKDEWLRLSGSRPELENGTYFMQISVSGKNTSVVISNEEGKALVGDSAKSIYQALSNILSK
ncbi:outer membrane protein assembly factor BamC [Rodentibacter caecimuris]|uniref:Outer membrane assembly protein BamC n=1 Tax=Rodentibacter caecimuris TaxID=1796644 RepID=A0ABX3L240_9PAST|nr:outer membrane assembly protein BamC [Rodentibacter heylii]